MTSDHNVLTPEDVLLKGRWIDDGSAVRVDEVCTRIQAILPSLRKRAVSSDGWSKLFQDPRDERFWELTYPQSEGHGGGAPQLESVSGFYAKSRYDLGPPSGLQIEAFDALCASIERTWTDLVNSGDTELAGALADRLRHAEWDSLNDLLGELVRLVDRSLLRENTPHLRWILTNLSLSLARFTSPVSQARPTSPSP